MGRRAGETVHSSALARPGRRWLGPPHFSPWPSRRPLPRPHGPAPCGLTHQLPLPPAASLTVSLRLEPRVPRCGWTRCTPHGTRSSRLPLQPSDRAPSRSSSEVHPRPPSSRPQTRLQVGRQRQGLPDAEIFPHPLYRSLMATDPSAGSCGCLRALHSPTGLHGPVSAFPQDGLCPSSGAARGSSLAFAPLPGTCQDLVNRGLCGCEGAFPAFELGVQWALLGGEFSCTGSSCSLCCSHCSRWHSCSPGIGLPGLLPSVLSFVLCFSFLGNLLSFISLFSYCFLNVFAIIFSNFFPFLYFLSTISFSYFIGGISSLFSLKMLGEIFKYFVLPLALSLPPLGSL